MTWLELWDAYLSFRTTDSLRPPEESGTSASTVEKLRAIRSVFAPLLGAVPLAEINETRLQIVQDEVRQGRRAVTVNSYFDMLRVGWKWGKRRGFVTSHMPDMDRLVTQNTKKRPFHNEECDKILRGALEFAKGRWYPVIRVAYETGCRISEACELRECDVDRIRGSVTLNGRKTKEPRTVSVSPEALAALPTRNGAERLFETARSEGYGRQSARYAFVRICEITGVSRADVDLHSFRRKMVADLVRTPGLPLPVAQKITGHKSLKIFLQYQSKATDDMARASEQVRAFRAGLALTSPSAQPAITDLVAALSDTERLELIKALLKRR